MLTEAKTSRSLFPKRKHTLKSVQVSKTPPTNTPTTRTKPFPGTRTCLIWCKEALTYVSVMHALDGPMGDEG